MPEAAAESTSTGSRVEGPSRHSADRGDAGPGMTLTVPSFAPAVVLITAVAKLSIHIATNAYGPYEFHRDEFLYFAMGEHLRLFSMDFPPFIAMVAEVVRGMLGDSITAIRLPVALASTALVVLAALSAQLLGGRRFAQGLAASCVLASLLFLRTGNLFQPVAPDQLWWMLALMTLLALGMSGNGRWWLAYGTAVGLGLLTKFSVLFLALATLIALIVTRERRWLKTRWPWLAAAIALVIGSPSIIGQVSLGFPVVGQMADLTSKQLERVTYL
ncbi:MAG TPA: glycosyltransferase family 39 protein [Rhodothermales bacterium]|nr:glycosyltransferase family 39 protein [Rhodothermales bacterium]